DGRVELVLARELRQVTAEVVERRGLRLLVAALGAAGRRGAAPDARGLGGADVGTQHLQGLRASLLERHAERVEDLRRDALLLAEKAEKQMLRADVGVAEVSGLGHRELEHLLGTARIGQLAERDGGLPLSDGLLHALVD